MMILRLAACVVMTTLPMSTLAQAGAPLSAEITVRADTPQGAIDRNIYGHFAEHLGRLVHDGLWVGEDSSIPNTRGLRNDVIGALKKLRVPVLRWPGGCFADEYHWRDGIGPRDQRPRSTNASWGGIETNAFGTHEFMDLVELIGADAYVNGNVASSTPQETAEWIEYMTSADHSTLADLRRKNGRDKPWKLRYFGVGNEPWGCGGNMRPEYYADEYKRFATFVRDYSGNDVQRIAAGGYDTLYNWTEVMMSQAAEHMDLISLHYYTLPTSDWKVKGSATQFDEKAWHATMARTLRMDEYIAKHSAIMDKHDPKKRIALAVDEWGTWYDPEPGVKQSALYQQSTVRDAVVAGANLNIFNQHSDRVRMANIAQMVNVLQAIILTDREKMILTPTYHVFDMYQVHQDATLIPVEMTTPSLSASASRDKENRLHVSIVNLAPQQAVQLRMRITGVMPRGVTGRVLTGPAINSMNTFEKPDVVKPVRFNGARVQGDQLTVTLPSRSVVVLEIQ